MRYSTCLLVLISVLVSCKEPSDNTGSSFGLDDLNNANRKLLEVAMEDGFSPAVASRVYVYPHIAHYITLQAFHPDSLPELTGKLNGLKEINLKNKSGANPELTALLAFCKTAKKLIFSENYMKILAEEIKKKAESNDLTNDQIDASDKCSDEIAHQLIDWFSGDNYIQTRTMDRFTSSKKPGEWSETPPDYTVGLEPHWMKMRPLIIDTASIFKSTGPPPYNASPKSDFYNMVMEVYKESKTLDSAKVEIAWFWDDNPNISEHRGHLITMTHKISPPGHWLNIIRQITARENSSLFKATKAYTFSAIAMFDTFLSCWYEKYKTNLVRPVTYIQQNIDVNWKPLIQTPPFPEYTSGHSAISAAAATILTNVFGDNYYFTDSTEVLFNLPVRNFRSFSQAAEEVSLSRFYAGIHYKISVNEGNRQGRFIASTILGKFK